MLCPSLQAECYDFGQPMSLCPLFWRTNYQVEGILEKHPVHVAAAKLQIQNSSRMHWHQMGWVTNVSYSSCHTTQHKGNWKARLDAEQQHQRPAMINRGHYTDINQYRII